MGEKPIPLSTDFPPICPRCHKHVYRRGRMAIRIEDIDHADNAESFTVCMHCSSIWRLRRENGSITLSPLTADERKDMWPVLSAAVAKFDLNRKVAARFGLTIEEFMDRIDLLPPEIRARLMDQ